MKKILLVMIFPLVTTMTLMGQGKFDVNVQAKTMHYWRGLKGN
jgi:uncharacterized protein YdeI (BOF family)